ncbi:hypothetical protein Q1695_007214 [Nippostrongylus brasiliensis]|nr:hypothetical protein Q1695_007214 [Nippostrongylus brasiliensis]
MTHEYVLDEERQDLEPVKQKDLLIKVVDSDDDEYHENASLTPRFLRPELELILQRYVENYEVFHHMSFGRGTRQGLQAKKQFVADLTRELNELGHAKRTDKQESENKKFGGRRGCIPRLSAEQKRAYDTIERKYGLDKVVTATAPLGVRKRGLPTECDISQKSMRSAEFVPGHSERHRSSELEEAKDIGVEELTEIAENALAEGAESQTVPALGNFPKPKQKSCTTTCCALEQLILAMKAKNNFELDAYDATCMNMASTLRTLAALDENLGRQWKLKMDELQLEAAREIVRLQESS